MAMSKPGAKKPLKVWEQDGQGSNLAGLLRHIHPFFERGLLIALMMDAVRSPETSINFYETIRRNKPEDFHIRRHL
jgi:hypothetical protein